MAQALHKATLRRIALAAAFATASSSSPPLPREISGATHWSPCYYVTELPSLWDGCTALARTGTRVAKLILDADPSSTARAPR